MAALKTQPHDASVEDFLTRVENEPWKKDASGREGDWPSAGFSPRKQALTLYIMSDFDEHDDLLTRLGRHKTGKSCLYIKKLTDIDMDVLAELVRLSVESVSASRDSANDG